MHIMTVCLGNICRSPAAEAVLVRRLAEAGLDWHWTEALYTRLLDVAGGKERIAHYWRTVDPLHAARNGETIDRVHAIKTRLYEEQVGGGRLPLLQLDPEDVEILVDRWQATRGDDEVSSEVVAIETAPRSDTSRSGSSCAAYADAE